MRYFYLILFAFWLSLFSVTFNNVLAQEANVVQYSIEHGLPQSQVNKILFDSRGMLWVATSGGGLCSFDGDNFVVFDESVGLAGNIVLDLEEDDKGRILCVSTWGGVSIIENNKVSKVIPLNEDLTMVTAIEKDNYGTVWLVGNRLCFLENDEIKSVVSEVSLPLVNEPNLSLAGDNLYVSFNNKLIVVDVVEKVQKQSKTYAFNVNTVYKWQDTLLIGSEKDGLFKEKNGTLINVNLPFSDYSETISITDFLVENNNKIWVTSRSGAFCLEKGKITHYAEEKGIGAYDLTSLCFDAQGNVWFGSKGEGVIGIVNTPFQFYSRIEGLNKSDNFGLLEDHLGRIWVANNEEGIYIYDENKEVVHLTTKQGLSSNSNRVLIQDDNHDIWVGGSQGLVKITPGLKITSFDEFKNESIKSLAFDKDYNLYIGTLTKGIWKKEHQNSNFQRLFQDEIFNAYSISFNVNNDIVIGTNDGCFIKVDNQHKLVKEGLKNVFIGNITQDKNGKTWVGTDRGISVWNGKQFISFDVNDGLTSDLVYLLFSDAQGFLWCGTNKGLDKISLNSNSEITKIKHYGFEEGFKGIEVNSKGFYENEKGELYFSTIKGIHKYSPDFDYNYSYNTPVYIRDIKLYLEKIDDKKLFGTAKNWFGIPQNITFETNENHLTFDFFAVDYLNPNGVTYTYFLEGFDKNWSPASESRSAVYSNLPPGNYTFKVKQFGNDFSQIASVNFRVKRPPPPFYKSIWFLFICLILFVLTIYYFTEYRTTKLRNQQVFLEAKIQERTLEIQESEKEKTILLQEVHHRVKNNLQIIISLFRLQSYFTENEEAIELFRNSQNRIRSMSKIHEKLYETKDLSKVEIKTYIEELVNDLVASYDIKNTVHIESRIQSCYINLNELTPLALIINEIITNALKYGLKDINDPTIEFSLKQTVIGDTTMIISDNGPGFDYEKWENHQSMGIELIKTLTEQLDGKITLDISSGKTIYTLKFKATL